MHWYVTDLKNRNQRSKNQCRSRELNWLSRYAGVVWQIWRFGPFSTRLSEFLEIIDLEQLNNVADITNFNRYNSRGSRFIFMQLIVPRGENQLLEKSKRNGFSKTWWKRIGSLRTNWWCRIRKATLYCRCFRGVGLAFPDQTTSIFSNRPIFLPDIIRNRSTVSWVLKTGRLFPLERGTGSEYCHLMHWKGSSLFARKSGKSQNRFWLIDCTRTSLKDFQNDSSMGIINADRKENKHDGSQRILEKSWKSR